VWSRAWPGSTARPWSSCPSRTPHAGWPSRPTGASEGGRSPPGRQPLPEPPLWPAPSPRGHTRRYGQRGLHPLWTPAKSMSITVNYATKTWYRQESRPSLTGGKLRPPSPTTSSCRQIVPFYMGETPIQLIAGIREAVRCGQLLMAGPEQVGGVSTIKLVPSRAVLKATGMITSPTTLWVSSSSYLPVRWQSDGPVAPPHRVRHLVAAADRRQPGSPDRDCAAWFPARSGTAAETIGEEVTDLKSLRIRW